MIKFENLQINGWEAAIRGMRNPMNSWKKSDSTFHCSSIVGIGENDLQLMKQLVKAGTDHSKFMRIITVTVDITAPLYWWKEFDTYKVGTVRNSCSTMHKIHEKEFTINDFSHEHLSMYNDEVLKDIVCALNRARSEYLISADAYKKRWWLQLIQLLPSSYNQRATVQLNYAVLRNMYHSRKHHKLDEWSEGFTEFVESLPYSELITQSYDKTEELSEKHWDECRQIAHYEDENKRLKEQLESLIKKYESEM